MYNHLVPQGVLVSKGFAITVVASEDFNAYNNLEQSIDRLMSELNLETFENLPVIGEGWTDALRELYPDQTIYTFWDYFRNAYSRDAGLRIDHFLLSPDLVPSLKAAGVDRNVRGWEKTSDHGPVWIEL